MQNTVAVLASETQELSRGILFVCYFMCMGVLPVHRVHAVPEEATEGNRSSGVELKAVALHPL